MCSAPRSLKHIRLGQLHRLPLFLKNLIVLKRAAQAFCRPSLTWDLPDVFLIIRQALWIWGRKTTEIEHCFPNVLQRVHCHQHDLSLGRLTLIAGPGLCGLDCPFSHGTLHKDGAMHKSHGGRGELSSPSLKVYIKEFLLFLISPLHNLPLSGQTPGYLLFI